MIDEIMSCLINAISIPKWLLWDVTKWYPLGLFLFIILIYCMHDRGGLHFLITNHGWNCSLALAWGFTSFFEREIFCICVRYDSCERAC